MYPSIQTALGHYNTQLGQYRLALIPITTKMEQVFGGGEWDVGDLDNTDRSVVDEFETKLKYMAEALGLTLDEITRLDNEVQLERPRQRSAPASAKGGRP